MKYRYFPLKVQRLRLERASTFDRKHEGRSSYLQPLRPTNKDDSDPTLLEDVLHSELKCVDLLRLGLAPLLDIHVVVIETHGDVLIEEVRKPSTVVGHLAGARHARDIRMGQRMRIPEVEEAVAEHQFEVIRARRINTRGHVVVLVVDGIDDDATRRDVESLGVVSIAAETIDVRPVVLTTELEVAINTLELRRELVFPSEHPSDRLQ